MARDDCWASNPISFTTPDGIKGRVWLASKLDGTKIIGDDRHWRLNVPAASKVDQEAVVALRDIWEIELDRLRGLRVHLGIDGEKALQVLGCGFRTVTVSFAVIRTTRLASRQGQSPPTVTPVSR
jgi:hypothetical protein